LLGAYPRGEHLKGTRRISTEEKSLKKLSPEGSENGETGTLVGDAVHQALVDFERTEKKESQLEY
jgi:cytochrome c556